MIPLGILTTVAGDGLGPELIANSGFDNNTAWQLSGNVGAGDPPPTISGGTLNFAPGVGDNSRIASQANIAVVMGAAYRVSLTYSGLSGNIKFRTVAQDAEVNGTGVYTQTVIATASTMSPAIFDLNGNSGTFDNYSVRRVL